MTIIQQPSKAFSCSQVRIPKVIALVPFHCTIHTGFA